MPLFILTALDRAGALDLRKAERPNHLTYLGEKAAMIKVGGPLLDEAGEMKGSLFILEAADVAEVMAFSAGDPFTKVGLFDQVSVQPWKATVGGFA